MESELIKLLDKIELESTKFIFSDFFSNESNNSKFGLYESVWGEFQYNLYPFDKNSEIRWEGGHLKCFETQSKMSHNQVQKILNIKTTRTILEVFAQISILVSLQEEMAFGLLATSETTRSVFPYIETKDKINTSNKTKYISLDYREQPSTSTKWWIGKVEEGEENLTILPNQRFFIPY